VLNGLIIPRNNESNIVSYEWSMEKIWLPPQLFDLNGPSLVIPANYLLPGMRYTFVLKGTDEDPTKDMESDTRLSYSIASIELRASLPPDYGTCAVNPLVGTGGYTNFDIICTGWEIVDDALNIPLLYSYYWVDATGDRNLITGPTLTNFLSTPLPPSARSIVVTVTDGGGGAGTDANAGNVTVNLPTNIPVATSFSQFSEAVRTKDSEKASVLASSIIAAALSNRSLANADRKSLVEGMIAELEFLPFPSSPAGFAQRAALWDNLADLSVYPNGTTALTPASALEFQNGLNQMFLRVNESAITVTTAALATIFNTTDKLVTANNQLGTFTPLQTTQDQNVELGMGFTSGGQSTSQPGSSVGGFTGSSSSSSLPTPAPFNPNDTVIGGFNTGTTGLTGSSDFSTGFGNGGFSSSSGSSSGASPAGRSLLQQQAVAQTGGTSGVALTGASATSNGFKQSTGSPTSGGYTSTQGLASSTTSATSSSPGGTGGVTAGGGFSTGGLGSLGNIGYTAGYTGGALAGEEGFGLGPQPATTYVNPSSAESSQQLRSLVDSITYFQLKNMVPNNCYTFTGQNVISYICRQVSEDMPLNWTVIGFGAQVSVYIPTSLRSTFAEMQPVTDRSTVLYKENPYGYLPSSNDINSYVVQNQFLKTGIPFVLTTSEMEVL